MERHLFPLANSRGPVPGRLPSVRLACQPRIAQRPAHFDRSTTSVYSHAEPSAYDPVDLTGFIQVSARERLEIVQNFFGRSARVNNHVDVIRARMCREKKPTAMAADLADGIGDNRAACAIQQVWCLFHLAALNCNTPTARVRQSPTWNVVMTVHGTWLAAMQMRSVAGKSDKVPHFRAAPSLSRLSDNVGN